MQQELVSVIMPSYNSIYIAESIDSVIAQSYQNWELLITDDCSTDNTRDVVAQYVAKDSRIKLFVLEQNSGTGVARNNSVEQAQGRFIAFLDSNDRWLPTKLEKQVAFMLNNGYEFTFTSYSQWSGRGVSGKTIQCKRRVTYYSLSRDCSVGCLTAMYDTQRLGKIHIPTFRKRQDWGLWFNIIRECRYGYGLQEQLAQYRLVRDSISSNKLALIKYNIAVYHKILGYPMVVSLLMFYTLFAPTYILKKIKLMLQ